MITKIIFISICLFCLFLFYYEKNLKLKNLFFIFLLVFISLISAYREKFFSLNLGADYFEYYNWFNYISF